jgi:hypothetical protein
VSLPRVEAAPCIPTNTGSSGARGAAVLVYCSGYKGSEHGVGRRKDGAKFPGSQEVPLGEGGGPTTTDLEGPRPTVGVQTIHKPVYYVSEVLHEAKARYLEMHKLIYVVLVVSRKLRHYFQAHRVVVVTSFPLRAILHNSNATCNIAKWAAELAEF